MKNKLLALIFSLVGMVSASYCMTTAQRAYVATKSPEEQAMCQHVQEIFARAHGDRKSIENYLCFGFLRPDFVAASVIDHFDKIYNSDDDDVKHTDCDIKNQRQEAARKQALFAKYWYLLYGHGRDFAGDSFAILRYGFSIRELLLFNKLPVIENRGCTGPILDLNSLRIDDLDGLQDVPGIANVKLLILFGNRISTLQPDSFHCLTSVTDLELSCNRIKRLPDNLFDGCCPNLTCVQLAENPLIREEVVAFMSHARETRALGFGFSAGFI